MSTPNTIWTDSDAVDGLATKDRVGFLVETYRPGRGSVYGLRNEPLNDAKGRPTLNGRAQPWNDVHQWARGLARVARHAKVNSRVCLCRINATPELLEDLGYPELAPEAPPPAVAYRATATGQTLTHYGEAAPEYRLEGVADYDESEDVVELPDGTYAYLADAAGFWGLYRRAVAHRFGCGEEHNARTAPETLVGIIGEAPVHPSERRLLRVSYRDLVGWAA